MSNKTTVFAVLAGIGAGAALGYWFASEKNDKLRKKISKALNSVSVDCKKKLINEFDELRMKANDFKGKGITLKDKFLKSVANMKEEGNQKVWALVTKTHAEANKIHDNGRSTIKQL